MVIDYQKRDGVAYITLNNPAKANILDKKTSLSDDPDRLVPLLLPRSQWLIVVAGDPLRNRSCIYRQDFKQGYATSNIVRLPAM